MSEARCLLIDFWMGDAHGEMSGRYGKLGNVQWRQECAAKFGLDFTLPEYGNPSLLNKSGQVSKPKSTKQSRRNSIESGL